MDSDKINKAAYLQRIVPPLMDWFSVHKRSLPWREDPLPYYVWVSEIMLQQTRVEAVKSYFLRFTKALPDVKALASCPEDKLMKRWEGLGYYNRARNLQRAARIMVDEYGGDVPGSRPELMKLPGIGSYTAGAVSSIAYGGLYPAVDGNALRLLSRILKDGGCIDDPKVKRLWEDVLMDVLKASLGEGVRSGRISSDFNFPGTFNQAMMDLGATVCLPGGEPRCEKCPLNGLCLAHLAGCETDFPVRRKKSGRRVETRTVLVIRGTDSVVIRKREEKGLLAGLWELPNTEGILSSEQAAAMTGQMGLEPLRVMPLPGARHVFSHVEWHMSAFLVLIADPAAEDGDMVLKSQDGKEYLLTRCESMKKEKAVPAAFSAYKRYLETGRTFHDGL